MGTGAIGSTSSFWQQDQSYWQQAQSNDSSVAASDSVINAMSSAETSLGKGLASIANSSALSRVNSQLVAAIQGILDGNTGSSSSSSSPSPAVGTGTASLSLSTPLSLLGIPTGGEITVSAGADTTTYMSTGTDTVGDLMNAINTDAYGNAPVTASLNSGGRLVLTSKNTTDVITVGGLYASNVGFGVNNRSFKPTEGTSSTSSTSTAPASTSTSTTKTSTAKTSTSYSTLASETASSAASVLSDSGAGGTLVDLLA
jgi:hypothetical protein